MQWYFYIFKSSDLVTNLVLWSCLGFCTTQKLQLLGGTENICQGRGKVCWTTKALSSYPSGLATNFEFYFLSPANNGASSQHYICLSTLYMPANHFYQWCLNNKSSKSMTNKDNRALLSRNTHTQHSSNHHFSDGSNFISETSAQSSLYKHTNELLAHVTDNISLSHVTWPSSILSLTNQNLNVQHPSNDFTYIYSVAKHYSI